MQARPIRRGPSSSSLSADPQGGRQAPLTLTQRALPNATPSVSALLPLRSERTA